MDLNALRIYMHVVEAGSLIAVAKAIRMDPSSISRTIASLEKELGVSLLHRTTRKLVPTEAGLFYYERISTIVDELTAAGSTAVEVSSHPQGVLRVTSSVSFGSRCIVPLLPEFLKQNDKIKVDLVLTDTVMDLTADRIDLALRLDQPRADSRFVARKLIATSYCVCASPEYLEAYGTPHSPGDLQYHNCLHCASHDVAKWFFRTPEGKVIEQRVDGNFVSTAMAVHQAALAGVGLALLPHWLVAADLKQGSLVVLLKDLEVAADDFDTAAWFIYPSKLYVLSKVRRFMDFMCAALPAFIQHRRGAQIADSTLRPAHDRGSTLHDIELRPRSLIGPPAVVARPSADT